MVNFKKNVYEFFKSYLNKRGYVLFTQREYKFKLQKIREKYENKDSYGINQGI